MVIIQFILIGLLAGLIVLQIIQGSITIYTQLCDFKKERNLLNE